MSKYLITVIVPTYNRGELLVKTLDSIYASTLDEIAVIVVDDGSSDDTRSRVDPFLSRAGFEYLPQPNQGRSIARNAGIRRAMSEYLMFLDDDDLLLPDGLETLLALAAQYPQSGMVAGKRVYVDERLFPLHLPEKAYYDEPIFDKRLDYKAIRQKFFAEGSYIVKRSLAESVGGFDKDMELAEDFDFFLKCCDRASVTLTLKPVVRIRQHGGNTPAAGQIDACLRVGKKNLQRLELLADPVLEFGPGRQRVEWLWRLGDDYYAVGRGGKALKYYLRAISARPSQLRDPALVKRLGLAAVPPLIRRAVRRLLGR